MGLSYLLIYVGAVSILFLFILMLINIRISELINETNNSIPLALLIGISFINSMYIVLPDNNIKLNNEKLSYLNSLKQDFYTSDKKLSISVKEKINYASSNIWDSVLTENSHITSIGNIMYTSYSILLIITSIILLLAMIGTICLVVNQKK
jgi:NADH-ubiquinone oxidoreductase chain 6